jgi:hypothetical protein
MTFRLPWVSRADYERVERERDRAETHRERAESDAQIAEARAERAEILRAEWSRVCADERARYDELFRAYDRLRVSGANPAPQKLPAPEKPTSPSDLAIEEKVKQFPESWRPALRRKLRDFQKQARDASVEEDAIADRIMFWSDPDDEESAA